MDNLKLMATFAVPANEISRLNGLVRLLLSTEPISVIYISAYQAFAREIYGALRKYATPSGFKGALAGTVVKWKLWGLNERVLNRILIEIFELPLPG